MQPLPPGINMFMRRWLGVVGVQLRISHLSLWVADASQAEANTIEITPIVRSYTYGSGKWNPGRRRD